MKKDIFRALKEAAILFLITLFVGLLLGFSYEFTKGPIEEAKANKKQNTLKEVFESASRFELIDNNAALYSGVTEEFDTSVSEIYLAYSEADEVIGAVVESVGHGGYNGDIDLYVGITNDRTVSGVSLLSINETAGLGMKAGDVLVPQYKGRNVLEFHFTQNGASAPDEIDAISGATKTTRAVNNAVNTALYVFDTLDLGGVENE